MSTRHQMIDDLLSLSESALKRLLKTQPTAPAFLSDKIDALADHLDLVRRDEFEKVVAMIAKARTMQEDLNDRLTALEAKFGVKTESPRKVAPQKKKKARLPSVKQKAKPVKRR